MTLTGGGEELVSPANIGDAQCCHADPAPMACGRGFLSAPLPAPLQHLPAELQDTTGSRRPEGSGVQAVLAGPAHDRGGGLVQHPGVTCSDPSLHPQPLLPGSLSLPGRAECSARSTQQRPPSPGPGLPPAAPSVPQGDRNDGASVTWTCSSQLVLSRCGHGGRAGAHRRGWLGAGDPALAWCHLCRPRGSVPVTQTLPSTRLSSPEGLTLIH